MFIWAQVELGTVRASSEDLIRRVSELEAALLEKRTAEEEEGQYRLFGGNDIDNSAPGRVVEIFGFSSDSLDLFPRTLRFTTR